jgi:CBS domain-containing protein
MKLSRILTAERIVVPLRAESLADALGTLLERAGEGVPGKDRSLYAQGLATGRSGTVLQVTEQVSLVADRSETARDLWVALGVAPQAILLKEGEEKAGSARILVLLVSAKPMSTLRAQVIPVLTRVFRDAETVGHLLAARSAAEVQALEELMELDLQERPLVQDAMTPVTYRVYPDAPIAEVMDLMVRRGVQAVPVVGEEYEFLGIITAGDALSHLLPRRMTGEGEELDQVVEAETAREVMSRSVMCVSEDQGLLEAANLMASKHVNQLPVIREVEGTVHPRARRWNSLP